MLSPILPKSFVYCSIRPSLYEKLITIIVLRIPPFYLHSTDLNISCHPAKRKTPFRAFYYYTIVLRIFYHLPIHISHDLLYYYYEIPRYNWICRSIQNALSLISSRINTDLCIQLCLAMFQYLFPKNYNLYLRAINLQTTHHHTQPHPYAHIYHVLILYPKFLIYFFYINPVSFIKIAVSMNKSSFSISQVVFPLSVIVATVLPYLFTLTPSHFFIPMTMINTVIVFESLRWNFNSRLWTLVFNVVFPELSQDFFCIVGHFIDRKFFNLGFLFIFLPCSTKSDKGALSIIVYFWTSTFYEAYWLLN